MNDASYIFKRWCIAEGEHGKLLSIDPKQVASTTKFHKILPLMEVDEVYLSAVPEGKASN